MSIQAWEFNSKLQDGEVHHYAHVAGYRDLLKSLHERLEVLERDKFNTNGIDTNSRITTLEQLMVNMAATLMKLELVEPVKDMQMTQPVG
jgi:hypothetical protein